MAKNKKKLYAFRVFYGAKSEDRHIRITHSMLMNEKFKQISYSAKVLYMYMKEYASGSEQFEYPQQLALRNKVINSSATFETAKKELIENGFIEVVRCCKCSRIPNLYKFSDKWYKN